MSSPSDFYKDWDGICQECLAETASWTMSMFSTKLVCWDCKDKEMQRPDYRLAVDADELAIKRGDYNYPGWDQRKVSVEDTNQLMRSWA